MLVSRDLALPKAGARVISGFGGCGLDGDPAGQGFAGVWPFSFCAVALGATPESAMQLLFFHCYGTRQEVII